MLVFAYLLINVTQLTFNKSFLPIHDAASQMINWLDQCYYSYNSGLKYNAGRVMNREVLSRNSFFGILFFMP